jgi:hypothetical protein
MTGVPSPTSPGTAQDSIPDDVRRFILTSIPSVPYLEAMLLLRESSATEWEPFGVARRLYIGEAQALHLLQSLQQAGVVTRREDGRFVYGPVPQELAVLVERLAVCYARDLVGVTAIVHSRAERRALQFADAFRLK